MREHGGFPEEQALLCFWTGARECRQSSEMFLAGLLSRGLITEGAHGSHLRPSIYSGAVWNRSVTGEALCVEMLTQEGDL